MNKNGRRWVREMKGGIGLGKGHKKKRGSKRKIEKGRRRFAIGNTYRQTHTYYDYANYCSIMVSCSGLFMPISN